MVTQGTAMMTELSMTVIVSTIVFAAAVIYYRGNLKQKKSEVVQPAVDESSVDDPAGPTVASSVGFSQTHGASVGDVPVSYVRPQRFTIDQLRDYYATVPAIYAEEIANNRAGEVMWMRESGLLRAAQHYVHGE